MSDFLAASLARDLAELRLAEIKVARIPITDITTRSSIRVKPRAVFILHTIYYILPVRYYSDGVVFGLVIEKLQFLGPQE
jgi:hypothetical protein